MVLETDWGRWTAELDPFEAMMWKSESNPRSRYGAAGVFLLDGTPAWDRVVERLDWISRLYPRLRQRIVTPPLAVDYPRWVVDREFDLLWHLRRIRLPEPGSVQQLLGFVETEVSSAFDRGRSPWTVTVVEGLEGDSAAFVLHGHHVVTDGVGAQQLFIELFDNERNPPGAVEVPAAPWEDELSELDALRQALAPRAVVGRAARALTGAVASAGRAAAHPRHTISGLVGLGEALAALRESAVPPSPVLAGRGASSRLAMLDVPLDRLKRAAKSSGGSLNDAFLAAMAGGLARYHSRMGNSVDAVGVGFPISVRREDDPMAGNRLSGTTVPAPTVELDPADRIRRIRELVIEAREFPVMDVLISVLPLVYRLPSWLFAGAMIGGFGIDVQTSNIPGSPTRQFLAGAELTGTYAFGPHPGTAMMVVLQSYVDSCCLGINVDSAAVTDLSLFVECLRQGFDEVLALAPPAEAPPTAVQGPTARSDSDVLRR